MSDEEEHDLRSREKILAAAKTESGHKGNQTRLQTVNNELVRNQTHQQQRLENELELLRDRLRIYTWWSRALTILLVILSALSLTSQIGLI
jgi:hypothetical protein